MFSKLALFTAASLAAFVAALPNPGEPSVSQQNCGDNTQVQCCKTLLKGGSQEAQEKGEFLGIKILDDALVGLNCVVDVGGCSTQTVCCSNNSFNGLIAVGCSPINV